MQSSSDEHRNTPLPIGPGTKIGEYTVIDALAAGGFGVVYRVTHQPTGRRKALKVLHGDLVSNTEAVLRFAREVDVIARLKHPNLVAIEGSGQLEDGRPYFVMELLEGTDLDAYIRKQRRLQPEDVLSILEPLCGALNEAHAHNIIHRDLKASNVFLASDGKGGRRVVLLDFGVAKLLDEAAGQGLTAPSHVVGTPTCMAPEQILGTRSDVRTDVYALGALVYWMLTGELPFTDASVMMVQYMHLNAVPVKPSSVAPIGQAFDALVLKAMSKQPEMRQPGVMELLSEFRAALLQHEQPLLNTHERRVIALYLEVRISDEALEDDEADNDLFRDMDSVLPYAARILVPKGFNPVMMTGNTSLLIKFLPETREGTGAAENQLQEIAARREAVRAVLMLERQLSGRPTYDNRVLVGMCLGLGTVHESGGKVADGDILHVGDWVREGEGLIGRREVFEKLGMRTEKVAGLDGYERVLA